MKVLCVLVILAVIGHGALALKCYDCKGATCAATLVSRTCDSEEYCYRQSKSYVLLEAGCGAATMCTKEECKETNEVTKCCCKKDDCNSAGSVTFNLVALVTLVAATFVF